MRVGSIFSIIGHAFVFLLGVVAAPSLLQNDAKPVNIITVELIPVSEESVLWLGSKDAVENLAEAIPAPSEVETENPVDAPNDVNATLNTLNESAREATHVEQVEPEQAPADLQPERVELEKEQVAPEPESLNVATAQNLLELNVFPKPKAENTAKKSADDSDVKDKDRKKSVEVKNQSESATFDLNEVATLLNKTDQTIGSDRKSEAKATIGEFKEQEVVPLSVSELDLLRKYIGSCWRQPAGAEGAQNVIVKLEIELGRKGDVAGLKVLDENSGQLYQAAVIRAKSAVYRCAPYQMLPVEKYNQWNKIVFTFNPEDLVSG